MEKETIFEENMFCEPRAEQFGRSSGAFIGLWQVSYEKETWISTNTWKVCMRLQVKPSDISNKC